MQNGRIQVLVRVRPLNPEEEARGGYECVNIAEDGQTVRYVIPTGERRSLQSGSAKASVRALTFDGALSGSQQPDVFNSARINQLLQDAHSGHAVTIFAYGQTGSGKTFTMTGPESLDYSDSDQAPMPGENNMAGLIPRALGQLFKSCGKGSKVRASYLELYNESINDLLNPDSTNLQLRFQSKAGAFVENLLQVDCESVADAMAVFAEGTANRKVVVVSEIRERRFCRFAQELMLPTPRMTLFLRLGHIF